MHTMLDMLDAPCQADLLPPEEVHTSTSVTAYDGFLASSVAWERVVEDAWMADNPINYRDPTGLEAAATQPAPVQNPYTGTATIYIWEGPSSCSSSHGHASMAYSGPGGSGYVSFWPKSDNPGKTKSGPADSNDSLDTDTIAEGRPPLHTVTIPNVDAAAMDKLWKSILADIAAGKATFTGIGNNCSTTVARVLWEGLNKTLPPTPAYDSATEDLDYRTAWTAGPAEIPGIDTPANLYDLLTKQAAHGNIVYWSAYTYPNGSGIFVN